MNSLTQKDILFYKIKEELKIKINKKSMIKLDDNIISNPFIND